MDAVKFLKEKDRLTKKCGISCLECRLSESNNKMGIPCYELIKKYPEKHVEIVEKWSEENPSTTNLDIFKKEVEKYIKNTFKDIKLKLYCSENMPYLLCPNFSNCEDCKEFWNSEYKGDEK